MDLNRHSIRSQNKHLYHAPLPLFSSGDCGTGIQFHQFGFIPDVERRTCIKICQLTKTFPAGPAARNMHHISVTFQADLNVKFKLLVLL